MGLFSAHSTIAGFPPSKVIRHLKKVTDLLLQTAYLLGGKSISEKEKIQLKKTALQLTNQKYDDPVLRMTLRWANEAIS